MVRGKSKARMKTAAEGELGGRTFAMGAGRGDCARRGRYIAAGTMAMSRTLAGRPAILPAEVALPVAMSTA